MKKIAYLLTAMFAVGALAGCGSQEQPEESKYKVNPEITGGSEEEKDAILRAINKMPIVMNKNGDTIKPLSTIKDDSKLDRLSEDAGDYIKLTTKQNIGQLQVNIEWTVDETSPYYASFQQSSEDNYHKILEIKYQGWGKPEGRIEWSVKSMVCGSAAVAKPAELKYAAKVLGEEYFHQDTKIGEFNAVTDEPKEVTFGKKTYYYPSTFDLVDYECKDLLDDKGTPTGTYSPYFISNEENEGKEKDYYYMNLPGKVVYLSPDGNWGLMADGKEVLELYSGSVLDLKTTEFPNFANEYIIASGNAAVYQGNIQLGYITKISKLDDHSKIAEPDLSFPAINAEEIKSWYVTMQDASGVDYQYAKQAIKGLPNSLRSVTGTLVADSILDKNGNKVTVANIDSIDNNRFTFQLKVGDQIMTVAYDYHTDRNGDVGLFKALKDALKSGKEMTIKGTMRYNNAHEKQFFEIVDGKKAAWNIVPYLTEHVSVAD